MIVFLTTLIFLICLLYKLYMVKIKIVQDNFSQSWFLGSIQKVESPPFCSAPLVLGKQANLECELQRNLPLSLQSPQRPQVWSVLVWDRASHLLVGLGSHQESPDHRPRSLHRFWSVTFTVKEIFASKCSGFFPAAMQNKGCNNFGIVDMKGDDWKKTKRSVWLCNLTFVEVDTPRLVTPPFSLPRLKKTVPAMNDCAKKVLIIL